MIQIIADTTSSIPVKDAQSIGVPLLPQIIIFGNESYRDDCEIDSATFLQKLRASSTLPKTAAPPPALYNPIYQRSIDKGDAIFVIAPSADVSGTVRSAQTAAQDFPGADIRVIDARTIASGLASIVLQANEWAKTETDPDILERRIRDLISREKVYFLVDTLEYLYKGGRIGGAQALVGSLLQMKPILTITDGKAAAVETQRTKRRGLSRICELVESECPKHPGALLTISHSDAEDSAHLLADMLSEKLGFHDIPIYELPPAIVVHAGPKTVSVSFFKEANA